jgi:hypothetical protein
LSEDLSESSGCDDDGSSLYLSDAITTSLTDHVKSHTCDLSFIGKECIKDKGMFDHFDSLIVTYCSKESARDFETGCITTCMEDSISKVSTLASERDLSSCRSIEDRTASDQSPNCLWSLGHQDLDCAWITEPSACGEGVFLMRRW